MLICWPGDPQIRFYAEQLAKASSQLAYSKSWKELWLFRTLDGTYLIAGELRSESAETVHFLNVQTSAQDAVRSLASRDRKTRALYFQTVTIDLLESAGKLDAEIREAFGSFPA